MTAPRVLSFTLPPRILTMPSLPSANALARWNFGHQRWRLTKLRTAYAAAILKAKAERGCPWGPPLELARISIVRYCARLLDSDNATAGAKGLIDVLVKQRIIRADDPSCLVSLVVSQVKTAVGKKNRNDMGRPKRGVEVTVEEVTATHSTPTSPSPPSRTSHSEPD